MNSSDARQRAYAHTCSWRTDFLGVSHQRNERRTWAVVAVTALMMMAEIAGGTIFGSMALAADGWHMATHAAALTIAALAYGYARRHVGDPRFAFGTGKVGELTGFASAIVLGVVALLIGWESILRLVNPRAIDFGQAIAIAVLGLLVNLVSAVLLHQGDEHDHGDDDHEADDDDHAHHHDSNLRAAYLHVMADAFTSVLAISGLMMGRYLGWIWMDAVMGMVGAVVIAHWSWGLLRSAGAHLIDMNDDTALLARIRSLLEGEGEAVRDLHLWRLGPGHHALVVAIESRHPASPDVYRAKLRGLRGLSHVTVEVNPREL